MFRHFLLIFVVAILPASLGLHGQAPAPSRQWRRIASLPPGTELLVRDWDHPFASLCTLAWIDNSSLACERSGPNGSVQRVVYPAASVVSVTQAPTWHDEENDRHITALVIGAGLGALAAGRLASEGSAGTIAASVFVGGALGGTAAYGVASGGFNPAPRPQWQFRVPLRALRRPIGVRRF